MILQEKLRGKFEKLHLQGFFFRGGSEDVEKSYVGSFGGLEGVEKDQVLGCHLRLRSFFEFLWVFW